MWYTMVAVLAFRWVFDNKAREVCQGREEGSSRTKIGIRLEWWNHEHVGWVQHHSSPFGSKTSFWNHVALLWQDTFPSHGIFCSFLQMTINTMMMNDDLIPNFCLCLFKQHYNFKSVRVDFTEQVLVNGKVLSSHHAVRSSIYAQHKPWTVVSSSTFCELYLMRFCCFLIDLFPVWL